MRRTTNQLLLTLVAAAGLALAACSTKSPSAPSSNPSAPIPPTPVVATTVTVTVNPTALTKGSTDFTTVTVRVTRADGSAIPAGSVVALATTLGSFGVATGGPQNVNVDLVNGQGTAQLYVGAADVGTATLRATFTASDGTTTVGTGQVQIRAADEFFVSTVSPASGPQSGGTQISISGGGFATPVTVSIGGVLAEIGSVGGSQIRAVTPALRCATPPCLAAGQTQAADVTVTTRANQTDQKSVTLPQAWIYTAGTSGGSTPQILSISPVSGPNEGGTRVTINGDGFEQPVQVLFQSTDGSLSLEATVLSVTRTQIVVLTPAAQGFGLPFANNNVAITVKNLGSGLSVKSPQQYRYGAKVLITSIAPGEGPYYGGTTVTIFGQGFSGPVAVEYGSHAQLPLNVTGSEVITRSVAISTASCADVTGASKVVNIDTGDSGTGPNFTYRVVQFGPNLGGLSPNTGQQLGGTTVTLHGTNFNDPAGIRVTFGGIPALVVSVSADGTTATVQTPTLPTTAYTTTACTSGSQTGTQFAPAPVDVVVTALSTTCASTFKTGFIYDPPSPNLCNVPPPAAPVASFSSAKVGLKVTFLDTSTGSPFAWSWDFGDGSPLSTLQNPTHTYALPGNYAVVLKITAAGGSAQTSSLITVP